MPAKPGRHGQPREVLDLGRRNSRYTAARRRIAKIVAGWPPLTREQLDALAAILRAGPGGES
jgi:hypothetical protein